MKSGEVHEVVELILASYPMLRMKMTEKDIRAMYRAYAAGLGDLDYAKAKAAIVRAVHTSEYIPSIALIRAEVGEVEHGNAKTGLEAWEAVARAMRSQGSHKTPGVDFVFLDPITAELVPPVIFREMCSSDTAVGRAADRARFIDAYDERMRQGVKQAKALPGATVAPQLAASRAAQAKQLIGQVARRLTAKPDAATPCSRCKCAAAKHIGDCGQCLCRRCEGFV